MIMKLVGLNYFRSSPVGLFKFIFSSQKLIKLEDIKFFFDNWEDRNPLLLKIGCSYYFFKMETKRQLKDLFENIKRKE